MHEQTSASTSRPARRLDEEGRARAASALGLAHGRARLFAHRRGLDERDLIGAAEAGLCRAAATFDAGLGVPFDAWASLHIRWDLRREERWLRRGGCALPEADLICPEPPPLRLPPRLEEAWSGIGERNRALVSRRLEGESLASIGRALGLSVGGAQRAYHRAVDELRRAAGVGRPRKLKGA